MANPDSTNTGKLPAFTALKEYERRATVLKSEGKTNEQIAANINVDFVKDYSERTVRDWFAPGGRLEQAFSEYNEALAAASLRNARQVIKKASQLAAAKLISTMNNPDARVALDAAKAVLNKYVPDKQIVSESAISDEDIPSELADIGDALVRGEQHGPEPVDDAPESPSAGGSDGSAGGEDVSAPVLPQPSAANNAGSSTA